MLPLLNLGGKSQRTENRMFELGPAADDMKRLVSGVSDDQLDNRTPCTDWTVRELLAHIHQFTSVFTSNASKQPPRPPQSLVDDWRQAIPDELDDLARAWRDDSAWNGQVSAGGVEMNASDNAVVAIEELTVHGWDLARATNQSVQIDDERLDRVDAFFDLFGDGPFGPKTDFPEGAARLHDTLARTGRNPAWQAVE
jgi:uncharacterized protein (TIGR03086 family)